MWGWLLGRIDFQCWVLGNVKVENREERGTTELGLRFGGRIRQSVALLFFFFFFGFRK